MAATVGTDKTGITQYPAPDGSGSGFCSVSKNASACYTKPTSGQTTQEANAAGAYGYGNKTYGEITYYVKWVLNGHQVTESARWQSTGTVNQYQYEGQLDSARSLANGSDVDTVSGTLGVVNKGTIVAGRQATWTHSSYSTNRSRYTQEVAGSWTVGGIPGFWYINVRSPIYTCATPSSPCYFSKYLPKDAVKGAYQYNG